MKIPSNWSEQAVNSMRIDVCNQNRHAKCVHDLMREKDHSRMEPPESMSLLHMLTEQITAKVAVKAAPDAVHMIGIILRVVILDQKRVSLDAVVVALAFVSTAHPGELDVREFRLHSCQARLCHCGRLGRGVLLNQ